MRLIILTNKVTTKHQNGLKCATTATQGVFPQKKGKKKPQLKAKALCRSQKKAHITGRTF